MISLFRPKLINGEIITFLHSYRSGWESYTYEGQVPAYLHVFHTGDFIISGESFPFDSEGKLTDAFRPHIAGGMPYPIYSSPLNRRSICRLMSVKKAVDLIVLTLQDDRALYGQRLDNLKSAFRTLSLLKYPIPASVTLLLKIRSVADYFGYNVVLKGDLYITRKRNKRLFYEYSQKLDGYSIDHCIYSGIKSIDGFKVK